MNSLDLALDAILRQNALELRNKTILTRCLPELGRFNVTVDVDLNTFAIAALFYSKQFAIQ